MNVKAKQAEDWDKVSERVDQQRMVAAEVEIRYWSCQSRDWLDSLSTTVDLQTTSSERTIPGTSSGKEVC